MNPPLYFDNNATTAPAPEVASAMMECLTTAWGNASSKHSLGEVAKARLGRARMQVAKLLEAGPAEILFTASATEANHQAILGALALAPGKRHIVASAIEHPSNLLLLRHLESQGLSLSLVGVDEQGRVDAAAVAAAMRPDTALVSLMWANNETGVLQPVADVAQLCRERGVLCHSDAVQAAGRVPLSVKEVPLDLLTLSGHKFHGPQGIGVLFVRKGLALPPLIHGHQERKRRGGTENLAAAVGLGVAADLAARRLMLDSARVTTLRDRLEAGIAQRLPLARFAGRGAPRLGNTCNVRFDGMNAEVLLDKLDKAGVCASGGSACTAGGTEASHVLLAQGYSAEQALASVRFSLSRHSTEAEVDRLLELLPDIVLPWLARHAQTAAPVSEPIF